MFKNETKNRMMAVVVVAMFTLSAFALVIAPVNADPAYNDATYYIHMTTDDSFSYRPASNLTGTTFTFDGMTTDVSYGTGNGANGGTATEFTYSPDSTGTPSTTVTALHSTTGQSTTQTINFTVYAPIAYSGPTSISVNSSIAANTAIASYTVSGMTLGSTEMTIKSISKDNTALESANYPFVLSNGTLSMGADTTKFISGTYTVVLTATDTVGGGEGANSLTKSADYSISVTINQGLAFTADEAQMITYIGATKSISFTATNYADLSDFKFTVDTISAGTSTNNSAAIALFGISSGNSKDYTETTNGKVSIPLTTSAFSNANLGSDYETVNFKITASGKQSLNGVDTPISVSGMFSLNIYKSLEFITAPIVGNAATLPASNSGLDVLMTLNASGARKITYNWGDGTEYVKNVTGNGSTFYSANHTYAKAGAYIITVTAENDVGASSFITPYNTGFDFNTVSEKKLEVGKISSTTEDGQMTLSTVVNIADGITPTYKWMIKEKDAETAVDASTHEAFVSQDTSSVKKTIVLDTSKLKDDTKITFQASYTFEGDTEATVKESNYTYNDTTTFMEKHGLLFIIFLIVGALVIAMTRLGWEYIPYQYVIGFVFIAAAVIAFFTNDFGLALWKF